MVIFLSETQRLALEWLIGGGSMAEAGEYAGVCRQTVSQWLNHDAEFQAAFEQWRRQARSFNRARLEALGDSALDAIVNAVREKRDAKIALRVLMGLGVLDTPR